MRDYSRLIRWSLVGVWAAVILTASNDSFSSDNSAGFLERLLGGFLSADVIAALNFLARKGAHVVSYGILGALAYNAEKRTGVAMFIALIVAIADEWHQSTTMLRTGSPWDVLLDLFGAAIAITLLVRIARSS